MSGDLIPVGDVLALGKRALSEETCQKFRYTVSDYKAQKVQVANYCNEQGQIIAQKIRFPDKSFEFIGDAKHAGLYGQHLWREKGKKVIITEGEIDALSVSQMQGNKWPVVSVPNGAQGAKKAISRALDWLEGFENVVLCFDNDDPGIAAAKECALLLTPGRARIAKLPLKDANEMLKAGRGDELIQALWDAKVYRPDGIVDGRDLWDKIKGHKDVESIPYPWAELNTVTHGLRRGELVTFTAGAGVGKSQVCREIASDLINRGITVGYAALEESTERTGFGIIGIKLNKPLHISKKDVSDDELKQAFDATIGSGHFFCFDHFGSTDSSNLLSRLRYLIRGCGCDWIVLDHISIVVSGTDDGDERKTIDVLMTKLRSLVEETGIGMIVVSHLKRPEGRGHEEGGVTSLSQLRGSASIGQLSDLVIGLERDLQDKKNQNTVTLRVLKNRFSGETGLAGTLKYDNSTGRLLDAPQEAVVEQEKSDF